VGRVQECRRAVGSVCRVELAFHDADKETDTDTDILVAKMSACRSACHRNVRKSRVSDVSARILAIEDVLVRVGIVEC